MNFPVLITWKNVAPSDAVEQLIRDHAAALAAVEERVTICLVTVDLPHRREGSGFRVKLDFSFEDSPDETVAFSHSNLQHAVKKAFVTAKTQLTRIPWPPHATPPEPHSGV